MEKLVIGLFDKTPLDEAKLNERLVKACEALGCKSQEDIEFGIDCLRRIVEVQTMRWLCEENQYYDVMFLCKKEDA